MFINNYYNYLTKNFLNYFLKLLKNNMQYLIDLITDLYVSFINNLTFN